jgi:TolA-binding protein
MKRAPLKLVVLVFACTASSACLTTRAEGEALRQDMTTLKSDMAELQRLQGDERTAQKQKLEQMDRRVIALETTLGTLRQADADAGVQLEKIVAEVQVLRGDIEQAKHELGETSASVQSILARPPVSVSAAAQAPKVEDAGKGQTVGGVEVPAEPKAHYDFAKKLFDEKKFVEAGEAFDLFLQRHASHKDLVDDAAFWKAEATFVQASAISDQKAKEKLLKQAILAYQRVLETPDSGKVDSALFKIGQAFEQLGFKDEAVVFYEELVEKHPKSPLVKDAKARLKALPKKKKGK